MHVCYLRFKDLTESDRKVAVRVVAEPLLGQRHNAVPLECNGKIYGRLPLRWTYYARSFIRYHICEVFSQLGQYTNETRWRYFTQETSRLSSVINSILPVCSVY